MRVLNTNLDSGHILELFLSVVSYTLIFIYLLFQSFQLLVFKMKRILRFYIFIFPFLFKISYFCYISIFFVIFPLSTIIFILHFHYKNLTHREPLILKLSRISLQYSFQHIFMQG